MKDRSNSLQHKREFAENTAIAALVYLTHDEDALQAFVATSGIDPSRIREAARTPGFLAGVLHYLLSDERLASGFAIERGLSPEQLAAAIHVLETA